MRYDEIYSKSDAGREEIVTRARMLPGVDRRVVMSTGSPRCGSAASAGFGVRTRGPRQPLAASRSRTARPAGFGRLRPARSV